MNAAPALSIVKEFQNWRRGYPMSNSAVFPQPISTRLAEPAKEAACFPPISEGIAVPDGLVTSWYQGSLLPAAYLSNQHHHNQCVNAVATGAPLHATRTILNCRRIERLFQNRFGNTVSVSDISVT